MPIVHRRGGEGMMPRNAESAPVPDSARLKRPRWTRSEHPANGYAAQCAPTLTAANAMSSASPEQATHLADDQPIPPATRRFSIVHELVRQNALALVSLFIALFGLGYNTWRNETTEHHRNVRQSAFIALDALGEVQQLADTRFFGAEHSEANRIAIWGRVTLVRDIATLVSADTAERADALFTAWSGNAAAFDNGDAEAERAVAVAIREARAQVLADLQRLR